MAIGSCVIAYPHKARLNVPLIDRKHIVYCKEDFSDLIDLCEYYLTHDDEREQIARNAREFFDLNLHKDNLVRYYLRTCLDRLK
jgi:spore maturation protein CgeB